MLSHALSPEAALGHRGSRIAVAILVAIQALIVLHRPTSPCYWTDELATLHATAAGPVAVFGRPLTSDWHPPLFEALLATWRRISPGDDERNVRLPSTLAALAALCLMVGLGRLTVGARGALLGGLLLALSPAMILHARIARYCMLFSALATGSSLAYVRAIDGRGRWATYAVVGALMLWTESLGVLVLAAQAVHCLRGGGDRGAGHRRALACSLATMGLVSLPWWFAVIHTVHSGAGSSAGVWVESARGPGIPVQAAHACTYPIEAWVASAQGLAIRLLYPIWGLTVGETLWPWDARVLVLLALILVAVIVSRHDTTAAPTEAAAGLLPWLIVIPWVGTATLMTRLAPFDSPLAIDRVLLPVVPPLALLLAAGLLRLNCRVRLVVVACLIGLELCAIHAYFEGNAFHNPSMGVDWRAAVGALSRRGPDRALDVVLCASEPALLHYGAGKLPLVDLGSYPGRARVQRVLDARPRRAWIVQRIRGERAAMHAIASALDAFVAAGYRAREIMHQVPLDPIARRLAEGLTGRPLVDHAFVVTEMTRGDPPETRRRQSCRATSERLLATALKGRLP